MVQNSGLVGDQVRTFIVGDDVAETVEAIGARIGDLPRSAIVHRSDCHYRITECSVITQFVVITRNRDQAAAAQARISDSRALGAAIGAGGMPRETDLGISRLRGSRSAGGRIDENDFSQRVRRASLGLPTG
jgi:hypothetical protein